MTNKPLILVCQLSLWFSSPGATTCCSYSVWLAQHKTDRFDEDLEAENLLPLVSHRAVLVEALGIGIGTPVITSHLATSCARFRPMLVQEA